MSHNRIIKTVFKFQSARVTLEHFDNGTAKLSGLYSEERGQGHASELLMEVTRYADKHELAMWLILQRFGDPHGGLSNQQLVSFYQKFGFDILDDTERPITMIRYPIS